MIFFTYLFTIGFTITASLKISEYDNYSFSDKTGFGPSCDALMAIFEIYNVTNATIIKIEANIANVSVWDGSFQQSPSSNTLLRNSGESAATKTPVTLSVALIGVFPHLKHNLTQYLSNQSIEFADVGYNVCLRLMQPEEPSSDYDFDYEESRQDPFRHASLFPAHVCKTVYPNTTINILIDSQENNAPVTYTKTPQFTPITERGYYISVDKSGFLKINHGYLPNDTSINFVWLLVNKEAGVYQLVSITNTRKRVTSNADGDLILPIEADNSNGALNFTIKINETGSALIFTKIENDIFCLIPFFGISVKIVATNEQGEGCYTFKFQVGQTAIKVQNHNTTFVDLYSTNVTEHVVTISDDEKESTISLNYFTSERRQFHVFLSGEYSLTAAQDLHFIADNYLDRNLLCRDSQIYTDYDTNPMISCIPSKYSPFMNRVISQQETVSKENVTGYKITRSTKLQIFRDFRKFEIRAHGLVACKGNETELCTGKISLPHCVVMEILRELGYQSDGVWADENNVLYYWMEGLVTHNTKDIVAFRSDSKI